MKNWSTDDSVTPNGYLLMRKKLDREGGQCANCPSVKDITVDHIIPQQLLVTLGFHDAHKDIENLQFLCKKCNVQKANILDYTNPKTLPLLKHYINRWIEKHGAMYKKLTTRKITARCLCHPVPEPVVSAARATWRSKPGLAPSIKPDVVRTKQQVDDDNW